LELERAARAKRVEQPILGAERRFLARLGAFDGTFQRGVARFDPIRSVRDRSRVTTMRAVLAGCVWGRTGLGALCKRHWHGSSDPMLQSFLSQPRREEVNLRTSRWELVPLLCHLQKPNNAPCAHRLWAWRGGRALFGRPRGCSMVPPLAGIASESHVAV